MNNDSCLSHLKIRWMPILSGQSMENPSMNARKYSYAYLMLLMLSIISFFLSGCPMTSMTPQEAGQIEGLLTKSPGGAYDYIIVDCSLPGQIRQLGQGIIYLARGESKKLTAEECAVRGGQFAVPGQTDQIKALMVWQPDAEKGDMQAQYYVGEIYQRGLGAAPNYSRAAEWYRKAAEQGYVKAQMSLAYLYEKGLGVEKNPQQALRWYRKASGLGDAISLDENTLSIEERRELEQLREEVKDRGAETRLLKQKLDQIQKELEETRRKLKQRSGDAETEAQRRDVAEFNTQIAAQEQTIRELRDKLAQNQAKLDKLPAPRIEVYDALPGATRGVRYDTGGEDSKKRLLAGRVWAPAGLAGFKVNQKTERVESDGKFRLWIPLNPTGETSVQLVAVDQRGVTTRITQTLAQGIDVAPIGPATAGYDTIKFGRYHALIIGNINYLKLPRLKTAVNDAREVSEILRAKYGFDTRLLLNSKSDEIMQVLNQYRKTLTENDNLLIYYAGHGYLDVKNNRSYWQAIDADPDSTVNWISDYMITDQLNLMSAKEVLIIADSCYSGALTRGVMEQLESGQSIDARLEYIKELAKGHARTVLSSGELAPVLDAGGGGHSVFANVLLSVLESNDQVIEGNRLHQEMSAYVVSESKRFGLTQVPLYAANTQAGHISGDFIFVPKKFQKFQ